MIKNNYVGISRDHSGSMFHLATAAMKDYNKLLDDLTVSASTAQLNTLVSVVEIGHNVSRRETMTPVTLCRPLYSYPTPGPYTPLFDSVGDLIEQFESISDPTACFLVMAVTDGQNNRTIKWSSHRLAEKIRQLQGTDRWTFVFRVPCGYKRDLVRLGIPEGNIYEWEQSERGVQEATIATTSAMSAYYSDMQKGVGATRSFYKVDLSTINHSKVKQLDDITSQVTIWTVLNELEGKGIRKFCESRLLGDKMLRGAAFYQLTKTEKVQHYKRIVVREKATGKVFAGTTRMMLGLPEGADLKIAPENHGDYEVYVQSTSVNRVLPIQTNVLYWKGAAT